MDRSKTEVFGNSPARNEIHRLVDHRTPVRVVALIGPRYLGKHSFISELLSETLSEVDLLAAEATVDGIREARDFLLSGPLFSHYKAVLVNDSDLISEPAQDALLKILEEPPASSRTFLVLEDEGLLLPALQNRFEHVVRWAPLSESEMKEYAADKHRMDEEALSLARGRPGLYALFLNDPRYASFRRTCAQIISGQVDPYQLRVPELVSSLKGTRSVERDALCHVIIVAASEFRHVKSAAPAVRSFLRLASDLVKTPSLNAEIHWHRACLHSPSRTV